MIRYTQTTKDILNFIEDYGFITSKICGNIMYKNSRYGVEQARKKLKSLVNNGDIKAYNDRLYGKELLYQKFKKPVSSHKYYLLNFYSEIYKLVDKVEYFKLEETWHFANKRSDGHIIISNSKNGKRYVKGFLIEFEKYHKMEQDKYDTIYETGEVQQWYKLKYGVANFPDIIVINYRGETDAITDYSYSIIGLDYNFEGLVNKVIL